MTGITKDILIDGRMGEGGGQVLRASLALSMALGKPFQIENIRASRPKPGLKRQHLAGVRAAAEICGAAVSGAGINSTELSFRPGPVRSGRYRFDIGSGGSCCLVLQAVLPPLMLAEGPSEVTVTGGTHVPMAPTFDFFQSTLIPRLESLGPRITAVLEKPGFMQVGGGSIRVTINPVAVLREYEETEAGEFVSVTGRLLSRNIDESIIRREAAVLESGRLRDLGELSIDNKGGDEAPGNAVILELRRTLGATVTSGIAERGQAAEKVARQALDRMRGFLGSHAPVEEHLADQMIVPAALAGGGRFLTEKPSLHTLTVMEVLPLFTKLKATARQMDSRLWLIEIGK